MKYLLALMVGASVYAELKLSDAEIVINCLMAIRNIEHDVGKENHNLVCEIAKGVRMKFDGHAEQAVNCEPTCRKEKHERSK